MSALCGALIFLALCFGGRLPFAAGCTVLAAVGIFEIRIATLKIGVVPSVGLALLGLLGPLWCLFPASAAGILKVASLAIAIFSLCWEVVRSAASGSLCAVRNVAYGLFAGGYVGLFGALAGIRSLPGTITVGSFEGKDRGLAMVLLVVFCVWSADTVAYLSGRKFGRRRLAPLLSPGKTVEGATGGLAGALMAGATLGAWFLGQPGTGLAVGLMAGTVGQLGDLFESSFKREVGIKDSGMLIPGHGGVLDRFDSLLFVAPLVWCLFQVLP